MSTIEEIVIEVPAYHMRMKDLVAKQKALYQLCAFFKPERLFDLWHEQSRQRDALRQSHRYAREQAKVGKAFVAEKKLEPEFWVNYPNHDGRRDTMLAVLKSKGLCTEHVTEVMPIYAKWLLTAKKTHADGRPMNRWALMTAWLDDTEI